LATSGTIGATVCTTGQLIDHVHRRCKLIPQQITSEMIDTALRLLWMKLTKLNERGIALWAIETQLVGLNEAQANITTQVGNIGILNSNLRQIQRIPGTPISSTGNAINAYDQDLSTACNQVVTNGHIDIIFDTPAQFTQAGFLPSATGVWNYNLQWSLDGVTWNTFRTVLAHPVIANQWEWYDLDGVPTAAGFRLQATNGTTLKVFEIVCGNTPSDIPMSPIAKDTWTQMPNKQSTGRPTIYYWDRVLPAPIMHIWPAPGAGFPLTFLIVNYVERQLQDVGTMTQQIEIPDRWFLPVIADLSREVGAEAKEVPPELVAVLDARAEALLLEAWNGESNSAPVSLLPNIGVYTA
jgi:hypothetical protein